MSKKKFKEKLSLLELEKLLDKNESKLSKLETKTIDLADTLGETVKYGCAKEIKKTVTHDAIKKLIALRNELEEAENDHDGLYDRHLALEEALDAARE